MHGEYQAHARDLDARHHADVADPERRPILTRLSTYPRVRGLVIGAFAETSADVRLLLRETAEAAAARFWRDAGATSATAAQSVYMSVYRRRWGAEFALQGARMRIARAYLATAGGARAARPARRRVRPRRCGGLRGRLCAIPSGRPAGPERVRLARRLSCCGRQPAVPMTSDARRRPGRTVRDSFLGVCV